MEKRWVVKEKGDTAVVKHLATALGVSESLANLMAQRNISSADEATAFLTQVSIIFTIFSYEDMNIAVDRISTAVKKNERILVYGDYDVDGTTAVALMYHFLKISIQM